MSRHLQLAVLGVAIVAGLGCGTKDAPDPIGPTGPTGRVRFVNLITNAALLPVNVTLEGLPFGVNLGYTATTPSSLPAPAAALYSPIYTGPRTMVLRRTADVSVTVATINFTVAEDVDHTVYAVGGAGATPVTSVVIDDQLPAPSATEVRFRVVNMSTAAVDVFITAAGADLATATPAATNVAPQTGSAYIVLAPGTWQIRTVPAGTAAGARIAAVNMTVSATVAGGTARTIVVATNNAGNPPLQGIVLSDR